MTDPKRLADGGGSDALRELLDAAEHDELADDATERVRAALMGAGIAASSAVALGGAGAKPATLALGWSVKKAWLLGTLIVGLVGAGTGIFLLSRPASPEVVVTTTPQAAPSPAITGADLPSPASGILDLDAPTPTPLPASTSSAARPVRIPPRASSGTSAPASTATASIAPAPPSPREGLLLLQARQALDGNPERALDLVRQHQLEFPQSQLAPERAKLRQQAELRLQH